jgi:SWI/SNF-related matrix-associated actin-dependent regulator of chromatin subfamily A member 5
MNRKEFNSQISSDSVNRLKFLLGESELFQHFLKKTTSGEKEEVSEKKFTTSSKEKKRRTEKEEDEELLKQETEQELPSNSSKTKSAAVITTKFDESPPYIHNGVLREYQIEGLNWLISLYENGLSGILADVFIDSIYRFN